MISINDSGSSLETFIRKQFKHIQVVKMERTNFNESEGFSSLRALVCRSELSTLEVLISRKYLCLAATHALLKFLSDAAGTTFLENSLHVDFRTGDGMLLLDPLTVTSLELLEPNITTTHASNRPAGGGKTIKSLFDVLNHTRTPQGARLLKCNLIQAPSDLNTIRFRQSCVTEILNDEKLYFGLSKALLAFNDMDPILSHFIRIQRQDTNKNDIQSLTENDGGSDKNAKKVIGTQKTLNGANNASNHNHTLRSAHSMISTLLKVKRSLNALPILKSLLISASSHPFFVALAETLSDPDLENISQILNDSMVDTNGSSGTSFQIRKSVQPRDVIFALKEGINGLLDAARQVYTERIEDIEVLAEEYKKEFPQLSLQLAHTSIRGYHLRIPERTSNKMSSHNPIEIEDDSDGNEIFSDSEEHALSRMNSSISARKISELPEMFILRSKSRNRLECSTEDLVALNIRLNEAKTEIILLTSKLLETVQMQVRDRIGCLYKLGESIALLDLFFSFATYVTLSPEPCCCPHMVSNDSNGHIQIIRAFHPLLLAQYGTNKNAKISSSASGPTPSHVESKVALPNHIRTSKSASYVHIVTGRNNSGKTTFLLKTAVLTLMAHMGSYIPATFASISLVDRILTCISFHDNTIATADATANSSFFFKEMQKASFILDSATSHSLVLLDELGKSTSTEDGVPICFAICEALISRKIQTFFATHFIHLALHLERLYPQVLVHKMDFSVVIDPLTGKETKEAKFTIVDGCEKDSGYGISMASDAGWPKSVVERAMLIRETESVGEDISSRIGLERPNSSANEIVNGSHYRGFNNERGESSNSAAVTRLKRNVLEQLLFASRSQMESQELNLFLHKLAMRYREKLNHLQS